MHSAVGVPLGAILIVEDEPILALELQVIVEEAGDRVAGPYAGLAAAHGGATRQAIDAALLDVNLENGETVYPLADELAARGTPFIFATGHGRWVERRFAHVPVVHKPYRQAEILAALRRVLHWAASLRR